MTVIGNITNSWIILSILLSYNETQFVVSLVKTINEKCTENQNYHGLNKQRKIFGQQTLIKLKE